MLPPPPRSTLFPYTTLFRSSRLVRMEPNYPVGLAFIAVGMAALAYAGDGPLPARLFSASRQAFEEARGIADRKSTRLNSSHPSISYAVFCLKKKTSILLPQL